MLDASVSDHLPVLELFSSAIQGFSRRKSPHEAGLETGHNDEMTWNYTKTMGIIVFAKALVGMSVAIFAAPPGSFPEYGSFMAAIWYGPAAKGFWTAVQQAILLLIIVVPIGLIADLVSHWRQKSRERGSLAGAERQSQLSRSE